MLRMVREMDENRFYHLGAIKSYFLSHEYHSFSHKEYLKNVYFVNLFSIYDFDAIYDDESKIFIGKKEFDLINKTINPFIKKIGIDARIYPRKLSENAFKLDNTDNDYILDNYTKNYVKNDAMNLGKKMAEKHYLYQKHLLNLKTIHNLNLIISFDFEYYGLNKKNVSEVGITLYRPEHDTITYKHFIISDQKRANSKKQALQQSFNFGTTETQHSSFVFKYLKDLMAEADMLIAHDIINELQILGLKPDWNKIIDTKICELVLSPNHRYLSLEDALIKHNIPSSCLHNAGNDSAYAMHLALKMFNYIT